MATALNSLPDESLPAQDGNEHLRFGIVVAEWNAQITNALYQGCYDTLVKCGVQPDNIAVLFVPGSYELTYGASVLIKRHNPDAVICLGCVIKGETNHDEYINHSVAMGLTNLGVASGKPCVFGLLTTLNEQQALDRAGGKFGNKGVESAAVAIKMARI